MSLAFRGFNAAFETIRIGSHPALGRETTIVYSGYIGIMEKKMVPRPVMENQMENNLENEMETGIIDFDSRGPKKHKLP